jgi:hypothetical protein
MGVIHAGTIARASPGRGGRRAHGGRHRAESPAGEKKGKAAGFGRRGSKAGAADGAGAIEEKGERRRLPARRQVRKRRGTAARRLKSATATTMPTTSRRRTTARLRHHHRRDDDGQNHASRVRRSRRAQWRASQARICGPRNMKGSRRQLLATWTHSHHRYRTLSPGLSSSSTVYVTHSQATDIRQPLVASLREGIMRYAHASHACSWQRSNGTSSR